MPLPPGCTVGGPCVHHSLSPPQWHNLSREEQAKYYELARKERQLHSQLYPTWSARDNYVSAHSDRRAARAGEGAERHGRRVRRTLQAREKSLFL